MAEPVKPKGINAYVDIVRQSTPDEYWQRVLDPDVPEAGAIYRAMARAQAFHARRGYEQAQAQFFRTHSTAGAPPASSYRYASGMVRIRRNADLGAERYIAGPAAQGELGAMILVGPGGRKWSNAAPVLWKANDPEQERDILFVSAVPGIVGNIDHLADLAGLITREAEGQPLDVPNTEPDLEVVHHAELSEGRTGIEATVLPPPSFKTASRLRDNGKADQFSATNRGIYIRIDDAANPGNVGRILRVMRVIFPGVQVPPDSGLYPHEIEVDDLPILSPLVKAAQDDGGVFTDFTAEANEDTPDDVELLPATPAVDDAFYFGFGEPFVGVAVAVTTPADGTYTLVWEYWNGGAWVAYPGFVDDSQGFHLGGELLAGAEPAPGDWASVVVDGVDAYYLRARVTVIGAPGQQPLGAKIRALKPNRLIVEDGTIQWAMLDWRDLRFDITRIEAFSGGRENTLGLLGEERGDLVQQEGEDDDAFRERIANLADVASPMAIRRAINRALSPYLLRGIAHDVQDGMTGLFCDAEDACDFYEPGDAFPVDPNKLLFPDALAYGGFEVILPYLTDGEFGCACDDGPVIYLEGPQVFLGPAADCCALDGQPLTANGIYSSIYQTIKEIKLFAVDFVMWRSGALNVIAC